MRTILSIRGGGIRGIIPACCLIQLEEQLGGLTRDHIDYCAGTSTGALLTAAVAAGVPATEILKIYTDRAKEIFTPTGAVADAKRALDGYIYDPKDRNGRSPAPSRWCRRAHYRSADSKVSRVFQLDANMRKAAAPPQVVTSAAAHPHQQLRFAAARPPLPRAPASRATLHSEPCAMCSSGSGGTGTHL